MTFEDDLVTLISAAAWAGLTKPKIIAAKDEYHATQLIRKLQLAIIVQNENVRTEYNNFYHQTKEYACKVIVSARSEAELETTYEYLEKIIGTYLQSPTAINSTTYNALMFDTSDHTSIWGGKNPNTYDVMIYGHIFQAVPTI